MAMGVTAATPRIFDAFLSADRTKTLFHGHSFTANPLACSAGLASLDLLEDPDCLRRILLITERQRAFAERLREYKLVRDLRTLGTVLAFELNAGQDGYTNAIGATLTAKALQHGIYLRPLGNTVYIMPPYCITEAELKQVYDFLTGFIEKGA
jgi:adenosylmethionine-8-amino-7-oxononanoate aminotransferase